MTSLLRHAAPALIALATLAATCAPAHANLLSNAGFEAAGPDLSGAGSYCYLGIGDYRECGSVPGWTGWLQIIAADSGPWGNPSATAGWTAAQGARIAGIQNTSSLTQLLNLAAGTYTLTWLDTNRQGYGDGARYQVLFDNTALDTFVTNPGDSWAGNSLSFTATAGNHTLRFQGLRDSGDGTSFIDALSLTAAPSAVPEPASIALVALALAGTAASRRRRVSAAG
jgi:hypothetical protein